MVGIMRIPLFLFYCLVLRIPCNSIVQSCNTAIMAWLTENLRDCEEWKRENLEISTSSNEAAKLYDSAIRQYVSWMEADQLDGFSKTLEKIHECDPNFVMGTALEIGLEGIGTKKTPRRNQEFAHKIEDWLETAKNTKITHREKLHVEAAKLAAFGDFGGAAEIWERILDDFPTDIVALKHAQTAYVFTGDSKNLRDSPVRVLPHWNKNIPLYGYVEGVVAFGYEEMCQFQEAESHAHLALELNKQDGWAAHAIAHVMTHQGRLNEGIKFLEATADDWKPCSWVAGHNFWHWALMHLENLDYEAALELFDQEIGKRAGNMLDVTDSASLLYRLQLEGVDVGTRWEGVLETCEPYLSDHVTSFNDAHFFMACLSSESNQSAVEQFTASQKSFAMTDKSAAGAVALRVGTPLIEGMTAYASTDYATAAEKLIPIFDEIYKIGGSHAQKDVFSQLAIRACMKSPLLDHKKKASDLFMRRQAMFVTSPLVQRLNVAPVITNGQ